MTPNQHPRSAEIAEWLGQQVSKAGPLSGDYYRVAGPRHVSSKDIISGKGAWFAGGRWNPAGVMNVIYASEQPETALREANEHFRYYNLPLWTGMPRVVVAVRFSLGVVLDLTSRAVMGSFPEPIESLMAEDWRAIVARGKEATTQAIGRAAFQAGLHGLKVPSKPDPNGVNLLVFPDLLTKAARIDVLNADELDKLGGRN